jgi:glycosyltransferase involved in cell wall biosynthesis
LRILEAIHDFLPDHRAGSEIYTFHLSRALAARGHEVTLLFTEKRLERAQFSRSAGAYEDLPFHEIVYNREFHDIADLYDDPRMEAPIGEVLDEVAPDVVHVQSLVYLGLGLIRAAAARDIPLVMTLHEYFLACPRGGLLLDRHGRLCDPIPFRECASCLAPYPIERERYPDREAAGSCPPQDPLRFFERAARVRKQRMLDGVAPIARFIAPSAFLAQRLIREGLPPAKVVVSDYGFPSRPSFPRRSGEPGAALRVGFLGTLADYKGVHVLVDAVLALEPGVVNLRIKGDPSWFEDYTRPLVERVATRGDIAFEGPIAPQEAPGFLAGLDLLVVPSLWYENSPLTIHEAWQAGVPVLATDLGGMAGLLAQGGGATFPRGDSAALAARLRDVATDRTKLLVWRDSIPPVKDVAADAAEVEAVCAEAVAGARGARGTPHPHGSG